MAALDPVGSQQQNDANRMNGAQVQPQYPAMPVVSDTKPLLKSFGATGTAIFSGIITSEEYNPDFYWRDGVKIYEQMLRNDAQVNATREMLELPIRRATWSIQPASDDARGQEIAAFVRACLFDEMCYTTTTGRVLRQKWDDILRHILLHLSFGFMAFEVNWRVDDGFVKWARWTPLLPRTVWRWWVGADNELAGIQQWTFKDYSYCFVDIPADKLLLFTRRQEGNNFEGVSVYRSAYKHWWMKQNFERIDAVGIERNAVVPPVIHLPLGFSDSDVTQAQQIAQNMRVNEMMGITLPPGWDLEYPKNQQRYAANTLQSIQYHDIMIARNVLAQFINLGSTETGAYSLDKSQVSTFLASLQAVCEYVEDVINSDAIKRLVDYNYSGVTNYPKLKCSKLTTQNIEALGALLAQLISGNTPLLTADPTLEAWLREQIGIPAAPQDAVQTQNPGAPTTPQRPEAGGRENDHSDEESQNVAPGSGGGGRKSAGGRAASTAGAGGAGGDGGAGAAAAEAQQVREEARLLRETLDAVYAGVDVVERGMVFFNPNHDARGRFAPGSGGGFGHMGGAGHHGGEGHPTEHDVSGGAHTGGGSGGTGHGGGASGHGGGRKSSSSKSGKSEAEKTASKRGGAKKPAKDAIHELTPAERAARGLKPELDPHSVKSIREIQAEGPRTGKFTPHGESQFNIGRAVNPHELADTYGEHQLAAVLHQYSHAGLKEAAASVGVKPGATKAETVSRITSHVTEGRYNGRFGSAKSSAESAHSARVAKLEKQIADHEAKLAALRAKHAELTKQSGSTRSKSGGGKSRSTGGSKPSAGYAKWRAEYQKVLNRMSSSDDPNVHHAGLIATGNMRAAHPGYAERYAVEIGVTKASELEALEDEIDAETTRLSELMAELERA